MNYGMYGDKERKIAKKKNRGLTDEFSMGFFQIHARHAGVGDRLSVHKSALVARDRKGSSLMQDTRSEISESHPV